MEPWTKNPGGDETSTNSEGSQNLCAMLWIPKLLTFSVETISNTPGFRRLVSHRGALRCARVCDLRFLRRGPNNTAATLSAATEDAAFFARNESSVQFGVAAGNGERPSRELSPTRSSGSSSAIFCVMCSSPSEKSGKRYFQGEGHRSHLDKGD